MIFNHLQAVQTQTLRSEIRTGRCVSLALSFQDEQTITRNQMNQKNLKFEKFEPVFSNMSGKINWSPAVSSSTCKYDKWRIPGLSWWIGWWGFRFSNRRPTPWLLNLNLTEVGSRKCLDHVGQKKSFTIEITNFHLVFMLKINPSRSLWLRVLEPRVFGGVPLRRFRNALANDHGVCWAIFQHTSDVAQSFNYTL